VLIERRAYQSPRAGRGAAARYQPHRDKRRFRWYGFYRLPEEYGGKVISIPHHQTGEDDRPWINRHRESPPTPEGSEDFARLQVLRPDAESINSEVERLLYDNRASVKGWRRQMVDLLGHARLVDAITLARCRAGERLEATALRGARRPDQTNRLVPLARQSPTTSRRLLSSRSTRPIH
jgi:hypothetical protein